jgi:hypothetical protein
MPQFVVVSPAGESYRVTAQSPRQAAARAAREASLPCEMADPKPRDRHLPRWKVQLSSMAEAGTAWLFVSR